MRFLVVAGVTALLVACGPSDTIDVTAPEGPAPARPDSGRPGQGGTGAGGEQGGAGGAGPAPGEAPPAAVDAAAEPVEAVDSAAPEPDAPVVEDAGPEAPRPMVDAPPPRVDTMPSPPDAGLPRDTAPAPVDMNPPPPAAGCLPTPANDEVISLFEDGNFGSRQVAGRGGTFWATINTNEGATATLTVPTMPVRCGSSRALRFAGTATTVTPIVRLFLVQGTAQFYDASAYRGVRFFLRSGVASRVRVKLSDRNTTSFGGMCEICNDHWGADLDVTPDWKAFTLTFASLAQTGTGDREESVDEAALAGIELVVRNQAAFELFIDDVSFFR